jgi:putative tricarboxylic transport membrane protein
MQEKTYKSADLWSGLAFAALGAYIIANAWQWEYLGADGPGPGFFPLWYGIAMLALSVCLVVASALRKPDTGTAAAAVNWRETGRALGVWLALVAAIAAFKLIGFVVSFGLLCFFIVAVMYRRPLALAAMVALAGGAGFYIVFPFALGVALPLGVFGF